MKTTFCRFDKGLFLKVHCYTIVYFIIFNYGWLKIFSNFGGSFLKVQQYTIIWFLIFNCGLLIQVLLLFYRNFLEITCFSILASETHLAATTTSENLLRSSIIDAIIFSCGPFIDAFFVLEDFFSRSRITPII